MTAPTVDERPRFTCPWCARSSPNPHDISNGYCGRCHWWTGVPELYEVWRGEPEQVTMLAAARTVTLNRYRGPVEHLDRLRAALARAETPARCDAIVTLANRVRQP